MTTRAEISADIVMRLKAAAPDARRVYRARLTGLPENVEETVCVYAPDESGEVLDADLEQFAMGLTIAVEARVAAADDWDSKASAIIEWAKATLFSDADWIAGFKAPMSFQVQQFVVTGEHGAQSHCVEILSLSLTPRSPQVFARTAPAVIGGFDIAADAIDPFDPNAPGGPHMTGPDGVVDVELTLDTPEE